MTYYLLKWNPANWPAEKFGDYFEKFERGKTLRWACGGTKRILPGDRFFLIKNGSDGRGIIGSGSILTTPFEGEHYDDEKARDGIEALFVEVKFDYLVKPGAPLPVARHELDAPMLTSNVWDVQGSGKTIPENVAKALTALWESRVEVQEFASPDDIDSRDETLPEGAKKRVTVNAYERNPEARRRCLNHWGYNCSVCNFRFDLAFGPLGKNYMHVHHLRPLATIGTTYEVDPIADLRPACPNCHAMLHRKVPPLSIEELQSIVATYRTARTPPSATR